MTECIALTFALYSDRNLDFVVILHKVVQLHGLLSIESQRLKVRQSITEKSHDLKTVNDKLILSKDSSSTFDAPASLLQPPLYWAHYLQKNKRSLV